MSTDENMICCPPFKPENWDEKVFKWENKRFIKAKVKTIFFMPLNFGQVMSNLDKAVRDNQAETPDFLCLSEHISKWTMNLYLAVNKELPQIENISLSGKYFSKVYEGSFQNTGKWFKDFEKVLERNNLKTNKMFTWYTTCPKCAKKYGKNYVVIIAELE